MSAPVNKHNPILAGATVSVTGTKEIDTGLRELLTFACSLQASTISANAEGLVTWKDTTSSTALASDTRKVTLYVWKHGTGSGSAGTTAINVSWLAIGN